jgi:hypothetical protein
MPRDGARLRRVCCIILIIMKTAHKIKKSFSQKGGKTLTLGNLVAATYKTFGEQQAPIILHLAMGSRLIRHSRSPGTSTTTENVCGRLTQTMKRERQQYY